MRRQFVSVAVTSWKIISTCEHPENSASKRRHCNSTQLIDTKRSNNVVLQFSISDDRMSEKNVQQLPWIAMHRITTGLNWVQLCSSRIYPGCFGTSPTASNESWCYDNDIGRSKIECHLPALDCDAHKTVNLWIGATASNALVECSRQRSFFLYVIHCS